RGDRMTTIADETTLAASTEPAVEELSLKERRGQVLLGTVTAAHFSHHVANSLLNPLLPLIRDAFALSYAESGFAVSAFSIAGGHLSFFAAPALAGILATATGTWRTPYIWFAVAPVVFGTLLWFVAPHALERAAPGDRFAAFREIGRVFRDVGPVVSLSIAFQFGIAALLAFLALYLVDARGLSPALAAVFFGVPQLVGVI